MRELFLGEQPYGLFAIIGIALVIQANWVFRDAEKARERTSGFGAPLPY